MGRGGSHPARPPNRNLTAWGEVRARSGPPVPAATAIAGPALRPGPRSRRGGRGGAARAVRKCGR